MQQAKRFNLSGRRLKHGKNKLIQALSITLLSENTSDKPNLSSEHGLSLYIQIDDWRFVFDTGASNIFLNNAEKMNLPLSNLNGVIISHGHYDHTSGLQFMNNQTVYLHPAVFIPKYKWKKVSYIPIGIPNTREYLEQNCNHRFIELTHTLKLAPDVWLISQFRTTKTQNYFFIQQQGHYTPDEFSDEIAITINTPSGLVIITGCSHTGIIEIIEHCLKITKANHVYALLGGFHLSNLMEQEIPEIARKIDSFKIANIGISHCTGDLLSQYLAYGNVFKFNTGENFNMIDGIYEQN